MTDVAPQPPDRLLDALCRQTIHLIDAARPPVRRMRVQAGDVSVEVEWPDQPDPAADGAAPAGAAADAAAGGDAEDEADRYVIRSPMVGTFYRAPEPGAPPFVEVGDQLAAGDQVGIVEAMKLMNGIQTEQPGTVVEMLVANGAAVEFDQPLLVLAPRDRD